MSAHDSSCFPDTVFEEMALDRLDDDLRQQVEEHLPTCKECTARHDAILSETRSLQEELRAIETVPDTPCIEQLTLALFIDGSLPNAERDSVETHLSICRSCQKSLIELHHTVTELTDDTAISPSASPQDTPTPVLHLPSTPAKIVETSRPVSSRDVKRSWPLLVCALLILGGGAVHFFAPDTVAPQLQLLIAAGAAYLIHDWVKLQLTNQEHSAPGAAPGTFALWAAAGFFAISFIAPQASPWCLTLSLVSYLLWLFGRTISHAAQDRDRTITRTAMEDENTEAVEETHAHIRNIKKSRK